MVAGLGSWVGLTPPQVLPGQGGSIPPRGVASGGDTKIHKVIEDGRTMAFPRKERDELDVRIVVLSRKRKMPGEYVVQKGG